MDRKQLTDLIYKKLTGTITVSEVELLEEALKKSPVDRKEFEFIHKYWDASRKLILDVSSDDLTWERVEKAIKKQPAETKPIQKSLSARWYYAAASILIVISCSILFTVYRQNRTVTHRATADPIAVWLPDSSKVWLNRGTELSYSKEFNKEHRQLSLTGEGYFEVTRDTLKPFVVSVGEGQVRVLGTSFNVEQKPIENSIEVAVFSGKVRLSSNSDANGLDLLPGQFGLLKSNQMLSKGTIRNANIIAWKEKNLVFEKVPLSEIASELEDYFNVKIDLDDPITDCEFTLEFENPTLEEVLQVLQISADIEFRQDNKSFYLRGPGCD